jgi:uncharacterized membrane protein (DUF4010 family)
MEAPNVVMHTRVSAMCTIAYSGIRMRVASDIHVISPLKLLTVYACGVCVGIAQKGALAAAAAQSEKDMASWKREGDAPWQSTDGKQPP